ncbi:MAG: DUF294 nucleotidyltransferase-like domain-containing protein [Pirellulales bacterium]
MHVDIEPAVAGAINELGPLAAYQQLILANDRKVFSSKLDNGREIAAERTSIHTGLAAHWLKTRREAAGYDRPLALVALGGTGRSEMTPCSDTDFALLFEDAIEGNAFLSSLLDETVHGRRFLKEYGFEIWPQPYNLDHMPALEGIQLNSFLDMRPIYDPHDMSRKFRERIRATFDPFEHFLHVSKYWRGAGCKPVSPHCERLDRFEIKQEGLRAFLAGVWTLGGPEFRHSQEVYRGLGEPRDLNAYHFLLRIRSFIHLRRGTHLKPNPDGSHKEDLLTFEDFASFGDLAGPNATERERFEFANQVRADLLAARRRVDRFARGVIGRQLQRGHKTHRGSSIIQGVGGLRHDATETYVTPHDRSSAALGLVLASQKYGVSIDPAELEGLFRNAGDWLIPVPELAALFYESRGCLARSLEFLAQVDGALERLFPGYGRFEASLDERVLEEKKTLRSAWVRQKLQALNACLHIGWKKQEQAKAQRAAWNRSGPGGESPLWDPHLANLSDIMKIEVTLLDSDLMAAVKLALLTKRLPLTAEDEAAREDKSLDLHERYASGFSHVPIGEYFARYANDAAFTDRTVRTAEFLVANRRAFKRLSQRGKIDDEVVRELVGLCGDEDTLRTLFVFTCADRMMGMPEEVVQSDEGPRDVAREQQPRWWLQENNPDRWFNSRELYVKALAHFKPDLVPQPSQVLGAAGYGAREQEVLQDFGRDFFNGQYVRHTNRFASQLLKLVANDSEAPKAELVHDGESVLLGVAARDFRGLAACIAGSLHHQNVALSQAHLFSASRYRLALDFFHLRTDQTRPRDFTAVVRDAVQQQKHISPEDAATLPPLAGVSRLDATPSGGCCLRHETSNDVSGLLYALCYKVYRELDGSIHALSAYTSRGNAFVTIHLTLPHHRSFQDAQAAVASW